MSIPNANGKNFLQIHDIHIINTFDETFNYIFELDKQIEECAETAHEERWRKGRKELPTYNELSEHFKQSNRNQVIDNFYKMYLLGGLQLQNCKEPEQQPDIPEEVKERMAEMEHRRWMIEKLLQGWCDGDSRNNEFKIHPDLKEWDILDKLDKNTTDKDREFIGLMIATLKNNFKNEE